MRFKTKGYKAPLPNVVRVGDIYPSKGGKGTYAFIIVSVRDHRAHAIGIDKEGNIITTTSYGVHAFERREKIGFCDDLANLTLEIDMYGISNYGKQ
jgi:hypothetical protein